MRFWGSEGGVTFSWAVGPQARGRLVPQRQELWGTGMQVEPTAHSCLLFCHQSKSQPLLAQLPSLHHGDNNVML